MTRARNCGDADPVKPQLDCCEVARFTASRSDCNQANVDAFGLPLNETKLRIAQRNSPVDSPTGLFEICVRQQSYLQLLLVCFFLAGVDRRSNRELVKRLLRAEQEEAVLVPDRMIQRTFNVGVFLSGHDVDA